MDGSDLPYVVPLEGGSNFRDFGGYRTADGATVRRGRCSARPISAA